jgi:hypothetical protein
VKLNFKFGERYIRFVMCWLAGLREIWGLDMRFLGGKRRKINARGLWLGKGGGGEADFSAALLTMRL